MYDEQYYEKCLLIDGRSVCCGFAVSKNIKSLGMNIKYLERKHLVLWHIKQYNFVYIVQTMKNKR